MASEVKLPESALEEKKASPEVIDFQAINNFVGTQNIKEQLGIKSNVVDENTVKEDVDLVKEEIPSVEPSQDVTEKPETLGVHSVNLEEELKELQEEQKCEEASSPIVETTNGETENGVHSNQFTEELTPEVVRADEIPANGTSSSSEEIQEKIDNELLNVRKIDSEEVAKEDAHQSQIPENAEADKDVIPGDTTTLSDKDCHKEAEIPVGDAKLTEEVEIPSTMTPPVTEEVSAEAEVKKEILEEVEQEQVHQTEVAKENLAEEKECQDEAEDESRGASETLTAEETIPEEASRENQAPEMISEETAKNEETSAKAEMDETGPTDSEETTPHEDSKSYDSPIMNEENRKGNEESEHLSEEVKETDVPVTATPLILEEDKESAEINEEMKEEAQQNQIAEGDEIDKEAIQSTPVTDLSESEHQDETEKEVENASVDPEEQIIEKVDLKEVESASVSKEVSEEKEKTAEEVQKEQAADENSDEEECPPDAGIQNTNAAELVVSEGTVPEEAIPESKTPNPEMQISEEVVPTEDSIGVTEKDETSENVEEDATEVSGKPHESALETTVSRDVTPEIEITDAEKTVTAETDNTDIKEIENEDEAKNSEEVEPSESSPESIQIEEATPNDCEEEKEGDDKIENIETNHEQEIESCLETEEQLEESKPSTSEEELSSERETMETKPIEEKADEENVAQDEITLDSKEAFGNDDEAANCDEKGDETREINLAEEHNTNDGINEDEEANEENLEERSEPTKPSDNTEDSSTAELPREEIQLETEIDVPSELAKSEEVLPETPSEGTVLSEMENIEHKLHDSERDDTEAGSSHETYELKEDEKSNTNEPGEMVQDFGVDEKPEEILPGNTVNETTPSIQNEEDPPEKDENINNEIAEEEHITEVEASTVATEVPAEEVQSSIDERSYKLDQSMPETASEHDNLPIASVGSEIETEKPEIGDASSLGEAANSVIPETDDKSELVVEPKEKTDEEVTQKVEEVEEPCIISHDKEEIAEPIKPSDNTEESTSAELPKEEIQLETETDVSSELAKSVEVLPETPSEGTVLSDMETEKIEEKVNDSERDDTEAGNLHETNELKEDEKSNTNEPHETVQNFEVSEKPAEILSGNIEHETTPSIQNAEDPPEKDESITNETTEEEHITEVEASTVVTEVPAEDVQNSTGERSYELDQSIPETASEQDIMPIASVGSEIEAEKPEVGNTSSLPQIADKSELELETKENNEEETLINEEATQKVEEVEEPCIISHGKEELPEEEESTIVHEETSIEPNNSTIQQDQETEESDANPIEARNATDDISVEEGSEASTTVISSVEQTDERSIDKEGTTTIKEENNVKATNEEAKIAEKLEESTEQIDQCTDPSNVAEVELSQTETVATETEILEVTPSEKLEESNPTDIDAKSAELEDTAEKSTVQEDVSSEPSNTREFQIDQTEITAEQDQPSEESEVKPTEPDQATEDVLTVENSEVDATVNESVSEIQDQPSEESEVKSTEPDQAPEDIPTVANSEVDATVSESVSEVENLEVIVQSGASVEQIEDAAVDKERSVVLQEEDAVVPEEEGQEIEAENVKHVEELPEKAESTIVLEETSIEPNINTVQQDQETEESDANLIEAYNATDDISVEEGSEATTTLVSSVEQTDERSIDKEGTTIIQEDSNVEAPNEEAEMAEELQESTEQIDQCTDPSNVAEVQLSQTETVAPETEILEVTPSEKLEEESNPIDIDAKSAELEDTAEKSTEQEEVSSEPSNTTEFQIDQTEITPEQDQPSEESEVKPTEPDQAPEDVPVANSEVDATVSESVSAVENSEAIGESGASVEQIEDVSVDKEESVVLQEEDAAVPEEEGQKIEAENEKHIEEDPQITTPSEANQTETVPPETEILEVVSNEVLGDENKHAGTAIKLAEAETASEEPVEEREILAEPNNTRELQVDQAEIIGIAGQDQPSEESEVKPTEPDQAKEDVPAVENSTVDATVNESVSEVENSEVIAESGASVEQIEDVSVDKEEGVVLQEEDVAVPEEEGQKIETENEKHIEEDPQITTPSEANQTETIPLETENLEVVSNEALGDENKHAGTDIKLAEAESATEEPSEEKEIPTEPNNVRELQVDEAEIVAEQDQPNEESEVKPTESDQATEDVPTMENSEVDAKSIEVGERSVANEASVLLQEEGVPFEMPKEVPQITNQSEVTEVELKQSDIVLPETETLEAVSHEGIDDERKFTDSDTKLAEFESATEEPSEEKEITTEPNNARELQVDEAEIIPEQDQPSQELEVEPTELDQAIEVPTMENSEVDATLSESVEEIGEGVAAEMPEEEATTEKQIEEEVSQIANQSEVSEVKLNKNDTVPHETEILEAIPHDLEAVSSEELGDDDKLAGTDIKLAEFESTTEKPSEEKEIPTEPNNTRELQVDQAEIIAKQYQPSEESEIKPTESDQAIEGVPTIVNSEVDAAVSETVQEIGETSVAKEESVILQEEGVAVEMSEDEVVNKKQIEEKVPQITNPNEVTQVELSQSETVPAETETLEAHSNEELGDENKLAGTNLVESEDTVEVPTEEKEVPTESSNTRDLQIDQSEIVAEQEEPSQESSDVKQTEPDQATEEASLAEKSDIDDATVTATTVEETKEESVVFEEENVAVEMPVEEATNEKQIKPEVTEVVYPSEITAEHPVDTETEIVRDERGLATTELKSDQMENYLPEGLTEEKLDAGVSSGVEEIHEKSEVSEVLSESTGEQVEGEETDAGMIKEETDQGIAAAEEEEPCEKHIEGEIHRTADVEIDDATEEGVKAELTEKEVDPQILEPQTESPEQEKATEESASVEEKSEASATLVPGQTQTEETESSILPQSVAESVIVPEEKISQEIEKNDEVIPTIADSEICDSVEVESNTISNEKELDPLIHETQTESPEQERETEESALLVENSVATAPSVPDEGQIEETEIANKEDGLLVQPMPESVVQPEETISQEVEANEEFSDKHIAGEILRTVDPAEISDTAEESKVILTEEDADSQKLGTETELPEQEETTEESTLIEEKSDATASLPPGDEHQSTAESVAVPEEGISQEAEAETIEESSAQNVTGESTIISNEEEVHSDKLITEIESPDPVRAAEELAEEKSADSGNVVPGEGQVEEREIANKESCVAPENEGTIESVTVPEERVPQGIETNDEPSDKHIVGEEDKVEQAQITASPVEQPDSENSVTELESALLEKTNGETDAKANIDEAGSTSFEGAVINQTDNEPETVPVVEQMHAEDEEAKGHTERDIDATELLKMPEIVVDETNEQTEDAVPNISEQNKEVEEEANQSEEPEQGFASIVSSFLINKVLSEENQKIDDGTEQNNAASVIPKTSDDETIQEVTTTRNEPETKDEDIPHATNSTEDLKLAQEHEEESAVKEVKEDGVEQDYLPVSRFLMDKILRQEETKYPGEEEKTEEPDKHVISDGGIQVQEDLEENSTLVVAPPEQNAEPPSSYPETAKDFETGKTLISEVGNTSIGDGAISSEEKIEETTSVEELAKQGEGNLSPEEVAGDLEKEEKPADEALEHIEDGNKTLVSDVVEQEGERSISPAEAIRDFDKEDTTIEQKNEEIVPSEDKVEEITGEVSVPMHVQVGEFQHEKPAEEKDETLDSKVTSLTEEVEDLACEESSTKDLVEETVVNAHEISNPEKIMEENETAVMQKEEERKDEAVAGEETPKDVKNVEENYVFVEHEVNQSEVTKEVLEEKVADEVSGAAITNLEEEQTGLSAEFHDEKRDMADSTENCPNVEQSLPDVPEVPMVTEIVKEHVGNEADFIHGEEQVKEVTGTVESFENKSQEKASEMEAAKMEKKSEEIKDDEQEEDEEEEEKGSHQEREAEITGGDPTVKSEAKETEMKSGQKKSLNILSGVGLKVITFTKVKKAFTGKSFTKVKKAFTGKSKSSSPSAK